MADVELLLNDDGPPSSVHIAFQAADEQAVRRFHAAGLAGGGADNVAPGERPYQPGYRAAYALDPDGYRTSRLAPTARGRALPDRWCPSRPTPLL